MAMRKNLNRSLLICTLLCSGLLSSCAAIVAKHDVLWSGGSQFRFPYPGTCMDVSFIRSGRIIHGTQSSVLQVMAVLDLPFSFAIDTVFLPLDLVLWALPEPSPKNAPKAQDEK